MIKGPVDFGNWIPLLEGHTFALTVPDGMVLREHSDSLELECLVFVPGDSQEIMEWIRERVLKGTFPREVE